MVTTVKNVQEGPDQDKDDPGTGNDTNSAMRRLEANRIQYEKDTGLKTITIRLPNFEIGILGMKPEETSDRDY